MMDVEPEVPNAPSSETSFFDIDKSKFSSQDPFVEKDSVHTNSAHQEEDPFHFFTQAESPKPKEEHIIAKEATQPSSSRSLQNDEKFKKEATSNDLWFQEQKHNAYLQGMHASNTYEYDETSISSPNSHKKIAVIIGGLILFLLFFFVWKPDQEQTQTQQEVSSANTQTTTTTNPKSQENIEQEDRRKNRNRTRERRRKYRRRKHQRENRNRKHRT